MAGTNGGGYGGGRVVDTTVGRDAVDDPARRPTDTVTLVRPPRSPRAPRRPGVLVGAGDRALAWAAWVQVLVAYVGSRVVAAVLIQLAAVLAQNPAGVRDLHPD